MQPMPLFFGEGAPLYAGGLGTVSLCPLPSYLLQAGSRTHPKKLNLDKLDKRLIYGQIVSFAKTISALDAAHDRGFLSESARRGGRHPPRSVDRMRH